jgi:RNA polymerase sigma-70 factor (ECF subfamily)
MEGRIGKSLIGQSEVRPVVPRKKIFCAATNLANMTDNASRGPDRRPAADRIDWQAALAEHDRWLRTAVYARLRDAHAVDDVMQEVALAAVRQAAPLRDPTKVAPWLYRLAIVQCLQYRRKLGRRRKLKDRFARQQRPSEHDGRVPDPLDWLLASERRRLVRAALEQLADRDAEILLLKYSQNWTYRQIAEHLGVSQSAVEARLHRARRRLRDTLAAMQVIEVG